MRMDRENIRKTLEVQIWTPSPRCSRVKLFAWNKCQRWWLILFSSIWYFVRIKKHVWSKQNTINMIFVKQVTFQDSGLDLDSGLWQIRGLGLDSDSRAKYSDLDSDSGCRKIWGLGLDSDSGVNDSDLTRTRLIRTRLHHCLGDYLSDVRDFL